MWSVWHRTFTAFSCFSLHPLVVDQPTAEGLVREMSRVELQYSSTRLAAPAEGAGAVTELAGTRRDLLLFQQKREGAHAVPANVGPPEFERTSPP